MPLPWRLDLPCHTAAGDHPTKFEFVNGLVSHWCCPRLLPSWLQAAESPAPGLLPPCLPCAPHSDFHTRPWPPLQVGNAIPPGFITAIEKGFKEAVNSGALIGHPVEVCVCGGGQPSGRGGGGVNGHPVEVCMWGGRGRRPGGAAAALWAGRGVSGDKGSAWMKARSAQGLWGGGVVPPVLVAHLPVACVPRVSSSRRACAWC